MNKLTQTLKALKQRNTPGFMMHIVAGYPDLPQSYQIAQRILASGADILEVQIPFSDPVADGPIIAGANEKALAAGTTVESSLNLIKEIASNTDAPVLIMTYFNIVHHYGVEAFTDKALEIGAQGLIIPDYPFDEDEGNELLSACRERELAFIQVIASTTREDRMQSILEHASGFVYCMARAGTTGKKTIITSETAVYLTRVRSHCNLPLAVGFGLSQRDQVEALRPHAEIMVVGSALIKAYADKPLAAGLKSVESFMKALTSE